MFPADRKLDKYQRIRLTNTTVACIGGAMQSLVLTYAVLNEYSLLNVAGLIGYLVIFWLVNFVFVALIFFGINLRFKDPSLSFAQMIWAIATSLFVVMVLTQLQSLIYLMMFSVMIYGIFQLREEQFIRFPIITIIAFGYVQIWAYIQQGGFVWDYVLTWAIFSFCLWSLVSLCLSFLKLRTRLKQKNQELENALAIKSQFLANMSHEIRTPMNGVLGMLDILLDSELPDQQRQYASIANSSAKTLLNLINEILDLSKIEAGKLNLETVEFNPLQEIFDTTSTFAFSASKKGLALIFNPVEWQSMPTALRGDSGRLRQVLNNLISNAIKFTDKGSVRVSTRTTILDQGECRLIVDIEDTGIGLSPEQLQNLFQPFTQAHESIARLYGGTGLGLNISKHISDLMGGRITVDSEAGKGSRFRLEIIFPLAENREAAIQEDGGRSSVKKLSESCQFPVDLAKVLTHNLEPTAKPVEIDQVKSSIASENDSRHCSILLVEDNLINQKVARILLEQSGYSVTVADNGEIALKILQDDKQGDCYQLLLMDCQMPVLDGYQTTLKIREGAAGDAYRGVPIVAMTAYAMSGDREKCLASKMDDYLAKPIDNAKLQNCLEKWLPNEQLH